MLFWRHILVCSACLFFLSHKAEAVTLATAPSDKELATLTRFRRQHRRTLDGRLCAAAFVQGGSTYTGCTDTPNPDGISGRVWCYVEPQVLDEKTSWGYCAPVVDYNSLRRQVTKEMPTKVREVQEYVAKLQKAEAAAKG